MQIQKEEKAKQFKEQIKELMETQQSAISEMKADQERSKNDIQTSIRKLEGDIDNMKKKHEQIMLQIEQDANEEKEQIEKKNEADISKIHDLSLKSKADLQLTKNKNHDMESAID